MRLDHPLDDVFSTASHVRILRALFGLPTGMGRSGRDLARRAAISHPRASQVLGDLAEQGLVRVERLPRADLYRLNRGHVLAAPLDDLFGLESKVRSEFVSFLANELKSRRLALKQARLFGSAARGDMTARSDADLALITSGDELDEVQAAGEEIAEIARDRFGTRINVLVGAPSLERLTGSRQPRRAVWRAIEREGIDVLAPVSAAD